MEQLNPLISSMITGIYLFLGFSGSASGKESVRQCRRHEMRVRSLGWKDPVEKGMATHSSILA